MRRRRCGVAEKRIRVLIAKAGLDGHDRGAKVVARALRDAGMEVVYLGLHNTPEAIVASAIQEDVGFIGISSLAGAHATHFGRIIELLREKNAQDIVVFGGGIIPEDDRQSLLDAGVAVLFGPGTSTDDIIAWVRQRAA